MITKNQTSSKTHHKPEQLEHISVARFAPLRIVLVLGALVDKACET